MGKFDFLTKKAPLNVLVALCVHRGVDPDVFDALLTLNKCPNPNMIIRCKAGDALIDRSRSIVATEFLKSDDYSMLLFIDDDIIFNPIDAVNLCRVTEDKNLGIAGGPYVKKQAQDTHYAIKTFNNEEYVFGEAGEFREVENVSTGFMCIQKHVLQEMVDKLGEEMPYCEHGGMDFWPFFQPYPKKIGERFVYLSEDWGFTQKWHSLGGKVYCDTKTRLAHAGRYKFDDRDILRPAKQDFKNLHYIDDGKNNVQVKAI